LSTSIDEEAALPRTIEADLNYYALADDPPVKPEFLKLPLETKRMRIEDARKTRGDFTLDDHGFQLVDWPTRVRNFRDPEERARVYVPEVNAMLKEITGASKVVTSGIGFIRISDRVGERPKDTFGTGNFVHADYSKNAGEFWLRRFVDSEAEAEERLKKRWSIFNVWKIVSRPPQDVPLALCDARSVAPRDVVHTDFTTSDRETGRFSFENATYRHNPSHRWYYFSDMNRDEFLVFRGFDSDPARKEAAPHTAFIDPSCPDDAPPRESVEIRSIAFYD
jgi:hypothetical protein